MLTDATGTDWSKYNFTREELADERTGDLGLADGFLETLQALRTAYGHAMVVTNGGRARATNRWLLDRGYPASENSFHLIENAKYETGGCCAVDVARPNGVFLHQLLEHATRLKWSIGVAKTFVHLDRRADYTSLKPNLYTY